MVREEVVIRAGRVRGVDRGHDLAFLGIPFAEAPVDDLRFAAPVPHAAWEGVRDATEYGATASRWTADPNLMPERIKDGPSTLNVNVFIPIDGGPGLPVMVWIHGGAYTVGSATNRWYEGAAFVRDGVIVVTISYRLGFDGFGRIDGAPDNRGVRDWILALEWVRDNIAAFGGDPERVTIAGQSAGGGAVLHLLGIPSAHGLFRAAVSLSGVLCQVTIDEASSFTRRLARAAHVSADRDGFATVDEHELTRLQRELSTTDHGSPRSRIKTIRDLINGQLPLAPIVDGELVPLPLRDAFLAGIGADVPLLLTTTDEEAVEETARSLGGLSGLTGMLSAWVLGTHGKAWRRYRDRHPELTVAESIGQRITDMLFRAPALDVALARGGATTWLGSFGWASPTFRSAMHGVDLPFFFDTLRADDVFKAVGEEAPQSLADELHGAALALIRGGEPSWDRWTDDRRAIRVLNAVSTSRTDGYRDVLELSQL